MQGGKRPHGFTIVEVMIVMAVTGVLLLSAWTLISGKQNQSEFQLAINDLQQNLQQIINETASGYYPGFGNNTCSGSLGALPQLAAGSSEQGTNNSCIFLGKAVRFGWGRPAPATNDYSVFPLAGNRLNNVTGNPVTSLTEAMPAAVAPGNSNATNSGANDDSFTYNLENGLTFYSGRYSSPANLNAFTSYSGTSRPIIIAFISDLGSLGTGDVLNSGSQQLNLYFLDGPGPWPSASVSRDYVDLIDNTTYKSAGAVQLCFNSGTTQQSGLITIGANISATATQGSGLSVSTQIFSRSNCT